MVIDTSALIAILLDEPEREAFERAIEADPLRLLSAVGKFEAGMVVAGRLDVAGLSRLDRLLNACAVTVVPFTDHHAAIARDAFIRYGKGRHPAGLNFGDCASYALAIAEAEPLLFKGTDFGATDVRVVGEGK
ncbi:MAG: type II toxin-antitoxin system VapC family toxin [Pseudolabrys sp.]|nr:type II toxin-antitoxin system VapC family toxin [Pseudolabrys sp.]MDP2298062.1 type II toxin-antitoxin system VapC family toxin [Pseudolabrys sp.]